METTTFEAAIYILTVAVGSGLFGFIAGGLATELRQGDRVAEMQDMIRHYERRVPIRQRKACRQAPRTLEQAGIWIL